jgi:transmembrane sensor
MKEFNFEILKRFLEHTTEEKETLLIKKWMIKNGLTEKDLIKLLQMPEEIQMFEEINSKKDWQPIRKILFPSKKSNKTQIYFRIAASIAILFVSIGIYYSINRFLNHPILITNNNNAVEIIMLPDSSEVFLNKNASVTYSSSYTWKRNISLDGQAYFEVRKNPKKPFTVKTHECGIKVLGTSFTVETREKDVEVIVNSGRVALYKLNTCKDTLFLNKGDKGIFNSNNKSLFKKKNEDTNYLSWQNHILFFTNTPITSVARDLEKYFKINIVLDKNVKSTLRYTSEFHNPNMVRVLKEMELVLNIGYQKVNNKIIIYQK